MVVALSLWFPYMSGGSSPRGYPCSAAILRLSWIRTGERDNLVRVAWPDNDRNPFNDDLIASGSDDGKVQLVIRPGSTRTNGYRSSSGAYLKTSHCARTLTPTMSKMLRLWES